MPRDKVVVEDPVEMTDEEVEKIWMDRLQKAHDEVRRARKFVKKHKLQNEDVLFIGALVKVLDGVLYKKGSK